MGLHLKLIEMTEEANVYYTKIGVYNKLDKLVSLVKLNKG